MKKRLYTFVHQDEAIVAVNKTAGLAVLSGRGRSENLYDLLARDPEAGFAGGEGEGKPLMVHRIDADTSGLIMFAKTAEAQKALSEQFRNRTVSKEYLALVRGTPTQESGSTDLPIGGDPHNKTRMVIRGLEAKKSRTKWVAAERFAGVTLMKVYPVTGRRHQIRVHLKAIGYPLAVDPYYGGERLLLSEFKRRYKVTKGQEERPLMERLTLHAHRLTFVHPVSGAEMTLEAELAKDFRVTLEALRKWARR